MDWLTFTSKSIDALAWPLALVIIVLCFRGQLRKLFDRIREVSGPAGTGAKFTEALARAEETAERAAFKSDAPDAERSSLTAPSSEDEDVTNFLLLADAHPEAALLEAYKHVDMLFDAFRYGKFQRKSAQYILDALEKNNYVPVKQLICIGKSLRRVMPQYTEEPILQISKL